MAGLDVNGVYVGYTPGEYTLMVYGRRDAGGDIVEMRLKLNADAIRMLNYVIAVNV